VTPNQCRYIKIEEDQVVWLQLCVKNNNGYFYTDAQRDFILGEWQQDYTQWQAGDQIMSARFPEATWHIAFKFRIPLPGGNGPVINYMMAGDALGVVAKLKFANKKESSKALANGYVVIWERELPLSMAEQFEALVEEAAAHIERADYLIGKKKPTIKTMNAHYIKMVRWLRRADFLYEQDPKHAMDDTLRETIKGRLSALKMRYREVVSDEWHRIESSNSNSSP
jgi:hypothetical protein